MPDLTLSPDAIRDAMERLGWHPEPSAGGWLAFRRSFPDQGIGVYQRAVFYAVNGWKLDLEWRGPKGDQVITETPRAVDGLDELEMILASGGPASVPYRKSFDQAMREAR